MQRGEIGHTGESERLTQFAMFAEPHLGFAKGPILIAHQNEDGQQLGLRELMFAETAALAWKHRLGDLQGDPRKRQETDFGHCTSCLDSKQRLSRIGDCKSSRLQRVSQQSHAHSDH